jgi:hypothetical protein
MRFNSGGKYLGGKSTRKLLDDFVTMGLMSRNCEHSAYVTVLPTFSERQCEVRNFTLHSHYKYTVNTNISINHYNIQLPSQRKRTTVL